MEFKIFEAICNEMRFRIEEDYPKVGAYLYIYKNEYCVRDDLQNSIKDCMEIALEEYGVSLSHWVEIKN